MPGKVYKFDLGAKVRCASFAAIRNIEPAQVIDRKFTSGGREVYALAAKLPWEGEHKDTGQWYDARLIEKAE